MMRDIRLGSNHKARICDEKHQHKEKEPRIWFRDLLSFGVRRLDGALCQYRER